MRSIWPTRLAQTLLLRGRRDLASATRWAPPSFPKINSDVCEHHRRSGFTGATTAVGSSRQRSGCTSMSSWILTFFTHQHATSFEDHIPIESRQLGAVLSTVQRRRLETAADEWGSQGPSGPSERGARARAALQSGEPGPERPEREMRW